MNEICKRRVFINIGRRIALCNLWSNKYNLNVIKYHSQLNIPLEIGVKYKVLAHGQQQKFNIQRTENNKNFDLLLY